MRKLVLKLISGLVKRAMLEWANVRNDGKGPISAFGLCESNISMLIRVWKTKQYVPYDFSRPRDRSSMPKPARVHNTKSLVTASR